MLGIIRAEGLALPADAPALRRLVQVTPGGQLTPDSFLSKFQPLRRLYRKPEIIRRLAREAVEDAARDNIRYLELRFTPTALVQARGFPLDEVMVWVADSAREEAQAWGIQVGLIVGLNRHEPVETAESVVRLAADLTSHGIVGLDLAGDEAGFAAEPFQPVFEAAREAELGLTMHAGEWAGAGSLRTALEAGAARIGHGIRILEDRDLVLLARERRTTFEVCLTSNFLSGVVRDIRSHPLPAMIQAGLQVTLNTDDPSVCGVTLTGEYETAVAELDLSEETIKGMILSAVQGAFLPPLEKKALEASFQSLLPGVG